MYRSRHFDRPLWVSATTFKLTLNIAFSTNFGGQPSRVLAASDIALDNTGLAEDRRARSPAVARKVSKSIGNEPSVRRRLECNVDISRSPDAASAFHLQTAWMLINTALDGRGACFGA